MVYMPEQSRLMDDLSDRIVRALARGDEAAAKAAARQRRIVRADMRDRLRPVPPPTADGSHRLVEAMARKAAAIRARTP